MTWTPEPRPDLWTAEQIAEAKVFPDHPWAGEHPEVAWAVDMHDSRPIETKVDHE